MKRLGRDDLYSSVRDGKVASQLEEPRTPAALALILTHIFLGRPEKPITMDVFVNQSTVAPGLSRCFIKPNCKMWVRIRASAMGFMTDTITHTLLCLVDFLQTPVTPRAI